MSEQRRRAPSAAPSSSDQRGAGETQVAAHEDAGKNGPPATAPRSEAATAASVRESGLTGLHSDTAEGPELAQRIAELQLFGDIAAETVERMPLGFVALDHELHVTYANPVALTLVGMDLVELVGRRPYDLFPQIVGTSRQTVRSSAGITVDYEDQIGPSERWVGVLACPTQAGTAVFLRDISERKRAEETVRRSVALMHGSLDAMLDAFVLCSAVRDEKDAIVNFEVEFANSVAGAFVGQRPEALIGALMPDLMPSLHGMSFLDACREVVETGEVCTEDAPGHSVPGPDGAPQVEALSFQIVRFNDGVFAVWRDVTEQRQARDALATSEARLRTAIDAMVDGVCVLSSVRDEHGRIVDFRIDYANDAIGAISGVPADRQVGHTLLELFPAHRTDGLFEAYVRVVETGVTYQSPDFHYVDPGAEGGPADQYLDQRASKMGDGYVLSVRDMTAERSAEASAASIARERTFIASSLADLQAGPTPAATAEAICRQVVSLVGLETAGLFYFSVGGQALPLGFVRADGVPVSLRPLPARRSERLREQAEGGPWVEAWVHRPWHPSEALFRDLGVKAGGYAPLRHSGNLVGLLIVSSADGNATSQLAEFLPALLEFAAVASALLGPAVLDLTEAGSIRHQLVKAISEGLFHPVFQPIVDLESRESVGFEALTRFDSGVRPDLCFAEAWSVGMGPALELATLGAAVAVSGGLPGGRWLSLNVSPRLLGDTERLKAMLAPAERPIVLEITEHEIIEDYAAVAATIRSLGPGIRIAVDDAGAGIANFAHIIELRPNIVKLDIGLVRGVNTDLGRQALVVGMRHFALEAGCRLLAEGVETQAEADTMLGLGVDLGQGYLFGRPEPVEARGSKPPPTTPRASGSSSPLDVGPRMSLGRGTPRTKGPGAGRRR